MKKWKNNETGCCALVGAGSQQSLCTWYTDRFILRDSIVDSRQTLEDAWNGLHQRQMKVYLGRCSMPSSYKRASKRDSRKSSASPPVFSFFLRIFSRPFYGCCDGALSENLQRQVLLLLFVLSYSLRRFFSLFSFVFYSRIVRAIAAKVVC